MEPQPPHSIFEAWRKAGGGPLALSILLHLGLLFLGGSLVISYQTDERQADFLPGGSSPQGAEASAEMRHRVMHKKQRALTDGMPVQRLLSDSPGSTISLPDAPPGLLDLPALDGRLESSSLGGPGMATLGTRGVFGKGLGSAQGFVSLPPALRSRCSTQERLKKLAESGGTPECERAVSASLEWLRGRQNKDGSWGQDDGKKYKAAMTGLALLCYLGRCETPDSLFYGDNVMAGILYLVELSQKNPHGMIAEDIRDNSAAYEHGIATYALGEMYTLARMGSKELPSMRAAFVKGVKLIIENQNSRGSWTYNGKEAGLPTAYTPDSKGEDLSVAGWQFQALKAAKNTRLNIPGLDSAIRQCIAYVLTKQTEEGGFGNPFRERNYNQWSLTGAGSLALQTMGKGNTAEINRSIRFLRKFLEAEPLDWDTNCNLYSWYYYTQTFFQAGGDDWKFYNAQFLPQILAAQQPDGSFKKGRASIPLADAADPLYRQVLCTLQLEVYYRYLKVADREEKSFFDR